MSGPVGPLAVIGSDLLRRVRGRLAQRSLTRRQQAAGEKPQRAFSSVAAGTDGEPGIDELHQYRRLDPVRLALPLVDGPSTAEDVVQDAFAALLRRHGRRLAGLDDPEAYLRTSVVNAARSVLRRRRTARAYVPERERHEPPADSRVPLHEEHQEVLDALNHLTRRQREVLVLRYWSNLTEAQDRRRPRTLPRDGQVHSRPGVESSRQTVGGSPMTEYGFRPHRRPFPSRRHAIPETFR